MHILLICFPNCALEGLQLLPGSYSLEIFFFLVYSGKRFYVTHASRREVVWVDGGRSNGRAPISETGDFSGLGKLVVSVKC